MAILPKEWRCAIASQRLTLDGYLQYEDGTDISHELVNGELVSKALGMGQHGEVSDCINQSFRQEIIRLDRQWVSKPPPLLVVEVVSESTKGVDYRAKRAEYSVLDIPEYWIVDPLDQRVTILSLVEAWYDAAEFTHDEIVLSPTFPDLELTVSAILRGEA